MLQTPFNFTFVSFATENMDVDEDYNDDEATNVAETSLGKLDSSVTPKKQPFKITENLNLESVDFSWLKEYFA